MADPSARITVHVTPRGGRDTIVGWRGGTLSVRVAAAPVEGAANDALARLIAKRLRLAPSRVTLVLGARSRIKTFEIAGISSEEIRTRIA